MKLTDNKKLVEILNCFLWDRAESSGDSVHRK